jgi:hypothetical protein
LPRDERAYEDESTEGISPCPHNDVVGVRKANVVTNRDLANLSFCDDDCFGRVRQSSRWIRVALTCLVSGFFGDSYTFRTLAGSQSKAESASKIITGQHRKTDDVNKAHGDIHGSAAHDLLNDLWHGRKGYKGGLERRRPLLPSFLARRARKRFFLARSTYIS